MSTVPIDPQIGPTGPPGPDLDVARDSDVPISTQIYWQLVSQIDSGRLLPGARLLPVRELGAALRVNPNTIRAVYRRLADAGDVTRRHGAGTGGAAERGAEALAETLSIAGAKGIELVPALIDDVAGLAELDRTADLILMS